MSAPAKAAPMREDVTQADIDAEDAFSRKAVAAIKALRSNIEFEAYSSTFPKALRFLFRYSTDRQSAADAIDDAFTELDRLAHTARPDAGDEDVERVACRFDGVGYSKLDLEIAQKAACAIVPLYGDGSPGEQDAARAGKLWNDHPAVQGALRALHESRSFALAAMREGVDRGMVEREKGYARGRAHAIDDAATLALTWVDDALAKPHENQIAQSISAAIRNIDLEQPR